MNQRRAAMPFALGLALNPFPVRIAGQHICSVVFVTIGQRTRPAPARRSAVQSKKSATSTLPSSSSSPQSPTYVCSAITLSKRRDTRNEAYECRYFTELHAYTSPSPATKSGSRTFPRRAGRPPATRTVRLARARWITKVLRTCRFN